ncbi:MAG: TonB-dependent receptor plug domain-containing protein [Tsuneonella sp.]
MRKYLLLLSVIAAPASAQEAGDTAITVTATGTRTDIDATGQPVTVLGQDEIESVQGADVTRVLRRAPGVTFTRNGGPGAFTGMRVRGAAAEQLLVEVDGVRVADPASPAGGFDLGNLSAGTIEKLDLLRGSNSTIWGSDAIGGVLLVTTRAASGLTASAEYGSQDTAYLTAAGGASGEHYFLGGSGSWYRTDGISAAAAGTEPDGFEQWSANGQARAYLSPTFELFARGSYTRGDLDLDGYPPPLYAFADTDETQDTRQYTGAAGAVYDTPNLFVQASYSFADTERATYDPALGQAPTYTTDGHSDRVSLRGEWRPIGPLLVDFGGEGEWTRFASLFDAPESTHIWGAYVQPVIEFGRLSAHVGVRRDQHARFGGATSFGADASYEVARDLRLRASYGEGFKAPSLFQLLSDYGNAALRPERSKSYDLGLAWRTRAAPTYAALTLFRRNSSDLIDFVSCFGVTGGICTDRPFDTYDNVGRARAEGFEVELGASPVKTLRAQLAYSYVRATDRANGAELARRPRHALTASLDWTTPLRLVLGGDVRLVGDSFDDAANLVPLDGYALVDLRASLPLGEHVELFGRIENLTDARYTEVAGYATRGRAAFVGARLRM